MLDEKWIVQYLAHPDLLGTDDVAELSRALERYPYCHVSRMLYLKALHNVGHLSFDAELARGAAFVADRKALFELIHRAEPVSASQPTVVPAPQPSSEEPAPEELSQWMDRQPSRKSPEELIDRFIRTNPRIKPASDYPREEKDLSRSSQEILSEQVMTETLARIYVRQKKYARAIEAYRILMLKNPKKSGYFADQIRELEKLKEKN